MIPLEFSDQSRVLNAPPGWNASQPIKCGMLPIQETTIDGTPAMYSYWKPDPDELVKLATGAQVRLTVYGKGHPPVWLEAEKCDAVTERAPVGVKPTPGAQAAAAVAGLNLQNAEVFFAVTVHRDSGGRAIPTITIVSDRLADVHADAMRAHLQAIADTLRAAYAPKDGAV